MTIRVMHLIGGGELGGAEHHVLNLLRHSSQEDIFAVLGCLVKKSPFAALARSLGIESIVFPMRFALDIFPIFQIVKSCRIHRIDLIHCHGTRANLVGRLAAKISSLPCISTVHSLPEWDYPAVWKGQAALKIDNLTLPLTSGFIAVSANIQENLAFRLNHQGLKLPAKTIYNGVNRLDFSCREQMRSDFRKKWNISPSCKLVGSIGRLHPVKGHLFLIEAMKLLMTDRSDLHLVIIGEGPSHEQLERLLISYQIPYTLAGYLPDAWKTLPAMDLFVLPSLSEGMGLVLLEAAQAEIPIVASRVGGIPELFQDNSEALLANPGDPADLAKSCSRMLNDPDLSRRFIINARQKALEFTIDKMAKDTTAFYHHILSQK
ncbi:MAG: glycosyltransferase [Peptococcaceae bacterium]|nr:glycosyltransferase [Peptococcaceae bacterium]